MSPFLREVRTASGATAVQIAVRQGRRDKVLEHLGSAHDDAELTALLEVGRAKLHPGQMVLDLGDAATASGSPATAVVTGTSSRVLAEVIAAAYDRLGFTVLGDEGFFQLVLARLVEPTSVRDSPRVLTELGIAPRHRNSLLAALRRAHERDYRAQIATACFAHASSHGDLTLVLYDVTTLYFEAEHEDALRKVGYSKERRVDPQIVVGLLVDRGGFPLEVSCWEGNKAETTTILPTIRAFQERHGVADMVVVADAGMLSSANLKELDMAGLRFIVGSRQTKAPADLASHFRWHGDAFADGQFIDTITPRHARVSSQNDAKLRAEPVWDPTVHAKSWRAVWAYSKKRATRDGRTLTLQENRARAVVAGERPTRTPRFVTIHGDAAALDEASLARARRLVGLKGYVTNIPATVMPAAEVITSYHDLWHVEQSFRISKTDLRARPMFHHDRDAIEAHLTLVVTALAVARHLQERTGISIKKIVRTLRPLRDATIRIAGTEIVAHTAITPEAQDILDALTH